MAARTGLTKAAVSSLVDRMIGARLVVEGEPQSRPGPGRRGTALRLSPAGPHGLGVEIGVDHVSTCLVDLTGRVRARWVRAGDNRASPPSRVLDEVAAAIRSTLEEDVSVGGVGWREVDVRGELTRRVGPDVPVAVGNEADLAAPAELWHGCGATDFLHVSGEIGIGAGIVLGGELFGGVSGFGGEIGHSAGGPEGSSLPVRVAGLPGAPGGSGRGRAGGRRGGRAGAAGGPEIR